MKYIFQYGGEDEPQSQYEDTSFFDTLSQYAQQANMPQDQEMDELEDPQAPEMDYDYEDLRSKYEELSSRFDELAQSSGVNSYKGDDDFLSYVFDDSNNDPMDIYPRSTLPTSSNRAPKSSGSRNGFQTFNSPEEGRAALEHQLELYKTGQSRNTTGNETLYEAMSIYAPAADRNNPKQYAEFIAKKLGINPNTPIKQVDTKKWADAVTIMEGNKTGNNPGNLRPFQNGGQSKYTF